MATPIAFESSWVKKEEKQKLKQARHEYLEKAKQKHDREEKKREFARQRGEDTWMLDSVTQRIDHEKQSLEKAKSKKHKKEKKRKKLKKEKKMRKKDNSSESGSGSDEEMVWVEHGDKKEEVTKSSVKGQQLQRDSWMESPLNLIPTVTRDELRKAKIAQDKAEKSEVSLLDQPGHHPRELNPFWKDGGTGLPEKQQKSNISPPRGANLEKALSKGNNSGTKIGDGGVTWLKKAYQRCQQLAVEEDKSLEEVAEQRYGSLERLQQMIADAEEKEKNLKTGGPLLDRSSNRRSFMRPRSRSRSRSRDRQRSRSRDRHRSRSGERQRSRDKRRSISRDRHRSRSRERHRSRSTDRRSKFLKPGDNDYRSVRKSDTAPAWKKKGFLQPSEEQPPERKSQTSTETKAREPSPEPEVKSGNSSSDSSSSDESTSPSLSKVISPEPILTEQQLNELGAKILRAEIMGDEDLANSLKSKLAAGQKARAEQKNNPVDTAKPSEEDEVVVLTRADKRGMVRPLPDRKHPIEPKGGRRKAGKAQTHSEEGHRQKYFDDDDKFDLKTLVEREKMGTAEDQDAMFARLAGRAAEKTDDEFQMDDLLIKNATRMQNDSRLEERERTLAITQHKKLSAALEKCQFCFEKVAKHLIIAIGTKVYLCLPNHRSLSEGHCVIVPMQHVSCGTALDEDVWSEIQTFRRSLTKMFESQDLDCVFMESAMYLRKEPHMSLECVPLPKELGDMAPIYFKKALLECESEWAQNKKVVDLSQKDVRRSIPKGFPYFSVDFGLQGGFAHVVEDEQKFTTYFGKEVVGGMMDVEPRLWRKPVRESFDDQRKKVLQFADWWKPFDWTLNLDK